MLPLVAVTTGIARRLRARELDPSTDVTVVLADEFPNFSICGIPYWVSGDVATEASLAHRTRADLEAAGITVRSSTWASAVDIDRRVLSVTGPAGDEQIGYDELLIGTGAERSARPGSRSVSPGFTCCTR